jgi:hypothetical protein
MSAKPGVRVGVRIGNLTPTAVLMEDQQLGGGLASRESRVAGRWSSTPSRDSESDAEGTGTEN